MKQRGVMLLSHTTAVSVYNQKNYAFSIIHSQPSPQPSPSASFLPSGSLTKDDSIQHILQFNQQQYALNQANNKQANQPVSQFILQAKSDTERHDWIFALRAHILLLSLNR